MRKFNFLLILSAMLAVGACSENEIPVNEEEKEVVNVVFSTQSDVDVTAGTRAAASDLTSPGKFSFYAFKKSAEGKYSFAKKISDSSAKYESGVWSSDGSLLAVGTYRFLCFYNLGANQALPTEESLKALPNGDWGSILNGMVVTHTSETADIDEFFCGESNNGVEGAGKSADVQITGATGNRVVVGFDDLVRVSARIDVKFVKLASVTPDEVAYGGTNTIFGSKDNLVSVELGVRGLAKKLSLGATAQTDKWATDRAFTYGSLTESHLVLGESLVNSIFPVANEKNMNDVAAMKAGIIKGGAYFRGAYILPFMNGDKLTQVQVNLAGKDNAARTIVATDNLVVEKNMITLITVKLLSSTPAGGTGNDEEHLFNPRVKFEVKVDQQYGGVNSSDVVVE